MGEFLFEAVALSVSCQRRHSKSVALILNHSLLENEFLSKFLLICDLRGYGTGERLAPTLQDPVANHHLSTPEGSEVVRRWTRSFCDTFSRLSEYQALMPWSPPEPEADMRVVIESANRMLDALTPRLRRLETDRPLFGLDRIASAYLDDPVTGQT